MESLANDLIGQFHYLGIFLVLFSCGLGLPIPEDIILFIGGYLVYKGDMHLVTTIVAALTGILGGDAATFFIGRRCKASLQNHSAGNGFIGRVLPPERLAKMLGYFGKYGNKIVFFGRFAAGMRAPLYLTAGLSGMPFGRFMLYDSAAAMISVPLLVWLAFTFGEELEQAKEWILRGKITIAVAIGVGVVIWLVKKYVIEPRVKRRMQAITDP